MPVVSVFPWLTWCRAVFLTRLIRHNTAHPSPAAASLPMQSRRGRFCHWQTDTTGRGSEILFKYYSEKWSKTCTELLFCQKKNIFPLTLEVKWQIALMPYWESDGGSLTECRLNVTSLELMSNFSNLMLLNGLIIIKEGFPVSSSVPLLQLCLLFLFSTKIIL